MKDNIQITTITPEMASQILQKVDHESQSKLQRKLSMEHVNFYAEEIGRDSFDDINVIHLMTCHETSLEYLVNGQHTLRAIVKSNIPSQCTLREQEVSTYKEVVYKYIRYDRGRLRSFKEAVRTVESELLRNDIEKMTTALKFIASNFGKSFSKMRRFNDEALLECAELYKEEFKKFKDATFGGDITHRLLSKSCLSVILLTFKYQPDKASIFWHQVAHGDKLSNTSSSFRLRREIIEHHITGGGTVPTRKQVKPDFLTEACILCWNAFYHNKSAKRLAYSGLSKTVNIAGVSLQDTRDELEKILKFNLSDNITFTKTDFSKIRSNNNYSYSYEGVTLERITSYIKKLCPPFDRDGMAQKTALATNRPVDQVLSEWDFKGKTGRELGEKVHAYIEERLNGIAIDNLRIGLNGSTPKEFGSFDKFYNESIKKGLKIEKSEWIIGDKDYKLGGRIDALFSHPDDGYVLIDFKTGKIEEWNRSKFYPPFDDISSDSLYQYSFQLSLYKIIIERNTNIEISKMYIVHLRPDGDHEVIPAEDYSLRLKQYLSK